MASPQGASAIAEPVFQTSGIPKRQAIQGNPTNTGPERGLIISLTNTSEHGTRLTNRIREIAIHIPWYGFKTQVRLAHDSGVSSAAISRLIRHQSQPSLKVSLQVTAALARRLGQSLDVREVFSTTGFYPTPSVCRLTGCRSCLPPEAYDENEALKPEYSGIQSGMWSLGTQGERANEA